MNAQIATQLHAIFALYDEIKLVYFFGSKARGDSGPISDYDFALYLDEKNPRKLYDLQFTIAHRISEVLRTDAVDIVLLNKADRPELKYHIITDGKLIFEREPYRTVVEPRILNEHFDFYAGLKRYGLTDS